MPITALCLPREFRHVWASLENWSSDPARDWKWEPSTTILTGFYTSERGGLVLGAQHLSCKSVPALAHLPWGVRELARRAREKSARERHKTSGRNIFALGVLRSFVTPCGEGKHSLPYLAPGFRGSGGAWGMPWEGLCGSHVVTGPNVGKAQARRLLKMARDSW